MSEVSRWDRCDVFALPDWIMCGGPGPLGVRILASKEMTSAELEVNWDWEFQDPYEAATVIPTLNSRLITLKANIKTFIIIDACDYPTAFRSLFAEWQPTSAERFKIEGPLAIEGGNDPAV